MVPNEGQKAKEHPLRPGGVNGVNNRTLDKKPRSDKALKAKGAIRDRRRRPEWLPYHLNAQLVGLG